MSKQDADKDTVPSCLDCKHFMPDEDHLKRSWFGLRSWDSRLTSSAVEFSQCSKFFRFCSVARREFGSATRCGVTARGFEARNGR